MGVLRELPTEPADPIRIGIVGEYFTAVDSHSNLYIEEKFIDMGVSLARYLNITHRNLHYNEENLRRGVSEYVSYDMGPTYHDHRRSKKLCRKRDSTALFTFKSSGCTPEIDVMPVLQRISSDYHILFCT